MECKKCKKECLETELINGFCKECLRKLEKQEDRKKHIKEQILNTGKTVIISSVISIILSVSVVAYSIIKVNGTHTSLKDFSVSDLAITTEKSSSYVTYTGDAKIYCTDTFNDYLLEVAITLLSGGNEKEIGQTHYSATIMHNGVAEISTYDYGSSDEVTSPKYKIEVIGFRNFNV